MNDAQALYIDLMKLTLTGLVYEDDIKIRQKRIRGRDWPERALTMIGIRRLDNLQKAVEGVLKDNIPGDFIETGVWRGGACIFMRALLKIYGDVSRIVWVADSFEGLPSPNAEQYPEDADFKLYRFKKLVVPEEVVQKNFEYFKLYDEQVRFLKGWFKDTLPFAPIKKLAILRLDGDYYESTMDALTNLYDKVSLGGWIIVDDYNVPPCKKAVEDFRRERDIEEKIIDIDGYGVYWIKR